jgi:hypothetical protein
MHDQRWDIELLEVLGEIGLGEGLDAVVGVLEAGLHAPEPELVQDALGDLGPRPLGSIFPFGFNADRPNVNTSASASAFGSSRTITSVRLER